jgi:hypothetical protein
MEGKRMETVRLKYLGTKADGLPVTFPVGAKQKSAWTKIVWANPFIDVTADEAAFLLEDSANWAKAEPSEQKLQFENVEKEIAKPKNPRASAAKVAAAESKEKRKPGRPKEYGQPKAAEPTAEVVPTEAAAEEPAAKPRGKKKN